VVLTANYAEACFLESVVIASHRKATRGSIAEYQYRTDGSYTWFVDTALRISHIANEQRSLNRAREDYSHSMGCPHSIDRTSDSSADIYLSTGL